MVELILTHGVDPNSSFGGQSEWRLYLEDHTWHSRHCELCKVFDCIKVMLRYGANFKQQCTDPRTDGTVRADELLKEWFDADQFGLLQDIVKRRERKSEKRKWMPKYIQLWTQSKK